MKYHTILLTATLLWLIKLNSGENSQKNHTVELLEDAVTPNPAKASRRAGSIRFEEDHPSGLDDISNVSLDDEPGLPLRFDDNPYTGVRENSGHVTFQDDNRFDSDQYTESLADSEIPTRVSFQDSNTIREPLKKKRRRRKRKPRYQFLQGQFHSGLPVPSGALGYPGVPLPGGPDYPGNQPLNGGPSYPGYPDHPYPGGPGLRPVGQYYRPPRRLKPSFASEALSTVTGALTSIALYDDYQCVPRLLCEAAGGGALGSSPLLQSVAGLQPLLTLLSAYNGISTSPLFVFGRAVFLGMTSKGNTASCRYAYPQCPTDPEQLVHYLNNHNGGFFRFFNTPQQQNAQNLEQFYNQLSGQFGFQQQNPGIQQNYGIYDPQLNQGPQNPNQQYGLYQPNPGSQQDYDPYGPQVNQGSLNQQYGLRQPYPQNYNPYSQPNQIPGPNYGNYQPSPNQQNYPYPQFINQTPQGNQNYGLYINQFPRPLNQNLYADQFGYKNHHGRRPKYPKVGKYGYNNIRSKNNVIEKRIQNKPDYVYVDSHVGNVDVNSKWIFPEKNSAKNNITAINNNVRGGKSLKFPGELVHINEESVRNIREGKTIVFPGQQHKQYYNYYNYPPDNNNNFDFQYQNYLVGNNGINNDKYADYYLSNIDHHHPDYNGHRVNNDHHDDDGVQTVYVVRGNGDPNNPEIFKIRPGERVML